MPFVRSVNGLKLDIHASLDRLQLRSVKDVSRSFAKYWTILLWLGDVVVVVVGHRTFYLQVTGSSRSRVPVLAGDHCIVAMGKLLLPVCLCHQAV